MSLAPAPQSSSPAAPSPEPAAEFSRERVRRPHMAWMASADLLALAVAFIVAFRLRLAWGGNYFTPVDATALHDLTPPLWLVLLLWLWSAWWLKLYRPRTGSSLITTVGQVVEAMAIATALTVVLSFLLYQHANGLSRGFLALLFATGVGTALALRGLAWTVSRTVRRDAAGERILVVGESDQTDLVRRLRTRTRTIQFCGLVATASPAPRYAAVTPVMGTMRDLRSAINRARADRVLVVDTEIPFGQLAECINVCRGMHVPLNFTGGTARLPVATELIEVGGVRLLEVRPAEYARGRTVLKRATDVVAAAGLLLVASPLFILLAIAIKVTSRGPVFFVSDRVGRGGRHFKFYKFRSMVIDAGEQPASIPERVLDGHVFKLPNDPRVTAIGRWMRKLSLDELPQFFNVLRGDMSLVGPRPLPAGDLDPDGLSAGFRTWSLERSTVRPGITGLWQVRGRSQLKFEEMVRLDLLYVRTWSYRLDLQILAETIPAVLLGRGAM